MKIQNTRIQNQGSSSGSVIILRAFKASQSKRRCNLCGHAFRATSKFVRYCDKCRVESELYHFSEWLSA